MLVLARTDRAQRVHETTVLHCLLRVHSAYKWKPGISCYYVHLRHCCFTVDFWCRLSTLTNSILYDPAWILLFPAQHHRILCSIYVGNDSDCQLFSLASFHLRCVAKCQIVQTTSPFPPGNSVLWNLHIWMTLNLAVSYVYFLCLFWQCQTIASCFCLQYKKQHWYFVFGYLSKIVKQRAHGHCEA